MNNFMKHGRISMLGLGIMALLTGLSGLISSCDSNDPELPPLYNEQDSLALCAIMAEAPVCGKSENDKWVEGEVHYLTPGFYVTWERVGGETSLRITGLELNAGDRSKYSENGTLSAAIGELTYLKNLRILGERWSGDMPDALGQLENIETLEINTTNFSKLPSKLNIRKAYNVVIASNTRFHYLCEGIEDFAIDVESPMTINRVLEIIHTNITGAIPIVKNDGVIINFADNRFTSADLAELIRQHHYIYFNANLNLLSGEIPESYLNSPDAIRYIIQAFGIQKEGYGYTNLPIDWPTLDQPIMQ